MAKASNNNRIGLSLDQAVACIKEGGIVAFPTETYYGLAVDPLSFTAVANLFKLKGRQADKPILLLIDDVAHLRLVVDSVPQAFVPLMEKYWPGPLTLVFPARKNICPQLTGCSGTIGIRVSSHPIASELARKMGRPITATSANISGNLPAATAAEVLSIFGDALSYIVDGGQTAGGLCSTVLGWQEGRLVVLRPGQIDLSAKSLQ